MFKSTIRTLLVAAGCAALLGGAFLAGQASADQPRMQRALDYLQSAYRELERAEPDKGGHRAKAMTRVRQAMDEVRAGIRYDQRN